MNQFTDEDHTYFVCKYCGRSSTKKEVIQAHEYEFHIKTAQDLRRLKPNPSFMVKKSLKKEYNQYKLENSNGSLLHPVNTKQEQKNYLNRQLLHFRIEDFKVTNEMAQNLQKCLKDCSIISTPKSTVKSSATRKIGTKESNTSQSQFRSNVKVIKTETHQSSPSSEIGIKMNPIPEENKEEENIVNGQQVESVKPVVKPSKRRKKKSYKPAKCKICHKVFAYSTYLYVHNKVHQDQKMFKCSICSFATFYSTALTNHVRIHTKEKPYVCRFCPMQFAQTGPRQYHERTKHPNPKQPSK